MLKDQPAREETGAEGHDVEMHRKRAGYSYEEEAEVTVSKNCELDKLVSREWSLQFRELSHMYG